jgi:hypothetical protein
MVHGLVRFECMCLVHVPEISIVRYKLRGTGLMRTYCMSGCDLYTVCLDVTYVSAFGVKIM